MSIKKKSKIRKKLQRKTLHISSKKIKVNFDELSLESKRSLGITQYYESYTYDCIGCGQQSLFPASLQQQWYEQKKKYFWMRPNKCGNCYGEWLQLRKEIATFPKLLRTPLTITDLTEMLAKLDRFYILDSNSFDYSLCNRIKKQLQSKQNQQ
jgi:hypothetical protein